MDNIWNSGEVDPIDTNFVLAATSFYSQSWMTALNVVVTPPIFVPHDDVDLNWKSAPYWYPYFSDGYKVYITTGAEAPQPWQYSSLNPEYVQSESTGYMPADPAFQPSNGYIHANDGTLPQYLYDCPITNVDKGALEPHQLSLGAYQGNWIRIAFVHDSYDDFVLTLDDIEVIANSGDNSCIDMNEADPFAICTSEYTPVCGCDGYTYTNACIASEYFGVQSFSDGVCTPTFIGVPEDETDECGESCNWWDYQEYEPPVVTAEISGDGIPVQTSYAVEQLCEFEGGFEVQVGYTTSYGGIIYLEEYVYRCEDTQPPYWTSFPSDIEIACWDDGIPVPELTYAFDNCSGDNIEYIDLSYIGSPVCPETFVYVYEWHAIDGCGNEIVDYSYVVAVDLDAPEITCPNNAIVSDLSAAAPSVTGFATAFDLCDFAPVLSYQDGSVVGGNPSSFVRTWTATDDCGNTSTCNQNISEPECGPLNINALPNLTIECGSEIPGGDYVVTGGCPPLDVQTTESQVDGCGFTFVLTRTYAVTDAAGSIANDTQVITVVDTTPPSVSANPDATVECGDDFDLAGASGVDNCGDVTIESDSSFVADCGNTGVWVITYTGFDDCGNSSSATQTITIVDTTDPEITCPPNVTVDDIDNAPPSMTGVGAATDACGTVSVTSNDGAITGVPGSFIRTWIATDECGNTSTCNQNISESDCDPLNINALPNQTIECGLEIPGGEYTVTGGCAPLDVQPTESQVADCGMTFVLTRTYVVTDAAGNIASDTQVITVVDTTPPSVSANPDATVECGDDFDLAGATGSDTCGEVTIESDSSFVAECGNTGVWVIIYTGFDDCGNSSSATQTITIVDTTEPEITCPPNVTVDDIDNAPASVTGMATATDACGAVSVTFNDGPITGVPGSFTRTWIATDGCGNTSTCNQNISESDCDPLNITSLPNLTVECGSDIPIGDYAVTGGCPDVTVVVTEEVVPGCGETFVIIRTYVVTDDAGTTDTDTQTVTIEDTTPPSVLANPDATVECGDDFDLAGAIGSDTCGNVTIESDSAFVADCGDTGVWTISYTATDDCGNTATATQTITIVDTTPPSLICPPDATVLDINNAPISETGEATASDNCGDAPVTFSDGLIENLESIRTWTGIDACGNSVECDQMITQGVGLLESETSVDFSVYPNPSAGQFELHINESLSEEFTWIVYDLIGKAVISGQNQTTHGRADLDLSGIATGGYFLLVEFEDVRGIQKIQINR